MRYGCEYRMHADKQARTFEVEAKNENEARIKMMKIAEKENIYVQNLGRLVKKDNKNLYTREYKCLNI